MLREKSGAGYKNAVSLAGHRHNHDEHGGCSHDRIGVCCCHNKLLRSIDVQLGVFTPSRAALFSKAHFKSLAARRRYRRVNLSWWIAHARATALDWAE